MTKQSQTRQRTGAAMVGGGAVVGGTGLVAGGIPGAKEPNSLSVWHLKGNPGAKSRLGRANIGSNARILVPQPRAGILGFRANTHDGFIRYGDHVHDSLLPGEGKQHGSAYERGMRGGKLEAEQKVVRGMRIARRASHPVTLGGAALAVAGAHRMNSKPVRKRRGVEADAAAVAGGTGGALLGVRPGAEAGSRLVNHSIRRQYAPGSVVSPGALMVRQKQAIGRGVKAGMVVGATSAGMASYRMARGRKVKKADSRRQNLSAGALGAGTATLGVGHFVPKGLDRFGRRYAQSSQEHVRAAQKLAPHLGGLQKDPAKVNGFGVVTRPERETLKPETPNWKLEQDKALQNKIPAKHRAAVGHHRGVAAQEKHFAEVFNSTSRVIRRFRGPGAALAGAGAAGLWASQDVRKSVQYGYRERKHSVLRTAELGAGVGLAAYGASRLNMVSSLARYGARIAEKQGAKPEQVERVMSAARAVGHGTRQVTGQGEAQLRRVKALDAAISAVPYGLRPAVATTAGVMLAQHAHPTTRETFTPIGRYA